MLVWLSRPPVRSAVLRRDEQRMRRVSLLAPSR
jgi:hypothetical protein